METVRKPLILSQILSMYRNGCRTSRICLTFGLSERRYYELVKRHAQEFERVKKKRLMNQKKKSKTIKELHQGEKVKTFSSSKKITPEERIAELERRLKNEQKKNQQLEALLEVANEFLGKS